MDGEFSASAGLSVLCAPEHRWGSQTHGDWAAAPNKTVAGTLECLPLLTNPLAIESNIGGRQRRLNPVARSTNGPA